MVAEAQRRWAAKGMAGDVGFLSVTHVGDANGYVSVYRAGTDRIALTGEGIHFKASTGALLREEDRKSTRLNSSHLVISYAVFCLPKRRRCRCLRHRPCHPTDRGERPRRASRPRTRVLSACPGAVHLRLLRLGIGHLALA